MDIEGFQITSVTAAPGLAPAYTGWTADLMFVDTPTGDGRTFQKAGLKQTRKLPLTLMFQGEDTGLGGHAGSYPIGQIVAMTVNGSTLTAEGTFDPSDEAQAAAAMIAEGTVNGISADLAIRLMEVTYPPMIQETADGTPVMDVPPEDPVTIVESSEDVQMLATDWEVMGATVLPFPGFANAHIEVAAPVSAASDSLGTEDTLAVALVPDDAAALAIPGGAPAESLHVTLCVVPADTDLQALADVVKAWAQMTMPLDGTITGVGLLGTPDASALVGLVSAVGLCDCREDIVDMLPSAGVQIATDYDFCPHLTWDYQAAGPASMDSGPVGAALTLGSVVILDADGNAGDMIPLTGTSASEAIEDAGEPDAVTAAVAAPPRDWFYTPEADELTPLTITPDGHVYGHLAAWGTCHTGGGCTVQPPANVLDYDDTFHLGAVRCADGSDVAAGPITMDAFHANVSLPASAAIDHYAHTGCAAAYVRTTDGALGPWVSGVISPQASEDQVETLRGSKLSGDWRAWPGRGRLGLLGILAVNGPGFPIPRALVAAAASSEGVDVRAVTGLGLDLPGTTEAARTPLTASVLVARARGVDALVALARA